MTKDITLTVSPEIGFDENNLKEHISMHYCNNPKDQFIVIQRSIDARKDKVKINLKIRVFSGETPKRDIIPVSYKNVSNSNFVVIIGAGPAGLFAALRLLELGIKPIVFERGKDVQSRRRDLANINKLHIVNPDSNYCFGEGGAGTYSDGKLYTRSKKRGDVNRILQILVNHGAKEDILFDSHPHIGTNKLPKLIQNIRETIINHGGEIHFNSKLTDIETEHNKIKSISINNSQKIDCKNVILSTGHSARDVFYLLHEKKIKIEAKPFAMGVRVEHQQSLIDKIQYKMTDRGNYLPAASYTLKCQTDYNQQTRGVFSFCMCPGGFIVPAATAPGEVVVNGMSPSRRDSKFSNSGIVVAINHEDLDIKTHGVFAGLELQKYFEQQAFNSADKNQTAPAQLLTDFVSNKTSLSLLETSYQPGIKSVPIHEMLPKSYIKRLQFSFKHFNKIMPGYLTPEAQILGVESRTSSPITIPRNKETLEHVEIDGLFPCGEGAGYAGGIVSAAIDGEKCAEKASEKYI